MDKAGLSKLEGGIGPVLDVQVAAIAKLSKVPISWQFEEEWLGCLW